MNLDGKTVFLAGATGLVGTAILKYFIEYYPNTKVVASYHLTQPFIFDKNITYKQLDLRYCNNTDNVLEGCDCAIMSAVFAGGAGFTKQYPYQHMRENLKMNLEMLEWFNNNNINRIIYIGSSTLYQEFEGDIKEDNLDLNKEPADSYYGYGHAVRFTEKMCKFFNSNKGREIIIIRASNIFGEYDRFNTQVSHFIPAIIRKAVDKQEPFEIWGSPTVTRDVIYVKDFARAVIMLLESDIKYDTFNIGSGIGVTVHDVTTNILHHAKHKPSVIDYDSSKPTTIKFRILNCDKIKKAIGWGCQYTMKEGIKNVVNWWQEHQNTWEK